MKKSSTIGSGGSPFRGSNGVYKVLKLKTGETVLCTLEDDINDFAFSPTIRILNPVHFQIMRIVPEGATKPIETSTLHPYVQTSSDEEFYLATDMIVTIGTMKRTVQSVYLTYVENLLKTRQAEHDEAAVLDFLASMNVTSIIEDPTTPGA